MSIEEKLKELEIQLPEFNIPEANYAPAVKVGNLIFTAGQIPRQNGVLMYKGKLGSTISEQEGYDAAKICALNAIKIVQHFAGSLDNVLQIVKMTVFINAVPDFENHAKIANGATDLLVKIFGDNGRPARSAVGMSSLPEGSPCEIEMIVQLKE